MSFVSIEEYRNISFILKYFGGHQNIDLIRAIFDEQAIALLVLSTVQA